MKMTMTTSENADFAAADDGESRRVWPRAHQRDIVNSDPLLQTLGTHALVHVRTRVRPFFHGQMKKTGNEMCFELVTLPSRDDQ